MESQGDCDGLELVVDRSFWNASIDGHNRYCSRVGGSWDASRDNNNVKQQLIRKGNSRVSEILSKFCEHLVGNRNRPRMYYVVLALGVYAL